ncbi:hypothetical protein B0H11DRAFT_1932266 [Mycena galericulata]|nr:hypothetical protein B0H11DRAFT_1932266 [Mycena galericulata]
MYYRAIPSGEDSIRELDIFARAADTNTSGPQIHEPSVRRIHFREIDEVSRTGTSAHKFAVRVREDGPGCPQNSHRTGTSAHKFAVRVHEDGLGAQHTGDSETWSSANRVKSRGVPTTTYFRMPTEFTPPHILSVHSFKPRNKPTKPCIERPVALSTSAHDVPTYATSDRTMHRTPGSARHGSAHNILANVTSVQRPPFDSGPGRVSSPR